MGKLNRQELKDAAEWLHIAWKMLARFNCCGIDSCDVCPMEHDSQCIANILGDMSSQANKMLELIEEEENHGNH